MLAYVFWHWPRPGTTLDEYEALLAAFHASLARAPSPGLRGSLSFRVAGLAWLGQSTAYEDWYLLDGSAALDPLDQAAVAAVHGPRHDPVARLAAGGTAGLYRLRRGSPDPERARHAAWLGKPTGMTYDDFYQRLAPAVAAGAALWGRQMVLGPTPEFCLWSPAPPALPLPAAITCPLDRAV